MGEQTGLPDGDASRSTARSMSLTEALAETEAMQAPAGVDSAVFGEMQAELMRVLQEQGTERFISTAPTSQASAVNDLMITHNTDGSADLTWTYKNQGDGDLNSEVNIADLTPMGIHLGKNGQSPDWFKAQNTDNDRNLEVNISDITPIGSNFLTKLDGYWLQRAVAVDSTWNPVSQIAFAASVVNSTNAQREFSFHLNVPADGNFYRVAPYEGGNIGIPSNAVQAESFVLEGRPGNVSATQGTVFAAVELSWVGIVEVDYYEIQRRTGAIGSFEHLADTPDSTAVFSDTNVASGTRYTYIVRGWKGDKKTDFSLQFEGWPLEIPLSPQNLAASDGTSDQHVALSWESVEHADEYVIYRSLEEEGTYAEVARTDQLAYDDTAAAPLDLNWYYVTASNQAGESAQSNKDSGYLDGALPVIESVSPLSGLTGDDLQMLALTTGAAPLSWSWNFGVAATPSTSSDASPLITLGDPGVYDCSVEVEGKFSNQSFNFQMSVTTDEWSHTFGTASADEGYSVGADALGNVYAIGRAGNPVVAKFNPSGVLLWAKQYQTTQDTQWISGSVSAAGDVFVATALAEADATVGKGVLNLKLDTDGNLVFARVFSLGDPLMLSRFPRTEFDADGNMYVCYTSYSLVNIEGLLLAYKLKAADGILVWKGIYDTPSDYAHDQSLADGIAVDSSGNLYVGADEANVTKLGTTGDVLWCRGWGDVAATPHEHAYTMGVDSNDNVYLAGGATFAGNYQPFLVKFDQSGTIAWQKSFSGGSGTTSAQIVQMEVDPLGNVYALNPQRGDPAEPSRFYMLDSTGALLASQEYTSTGSSKVFALNYFDGKVQFCGQAPDPEGVWTNYLDTLSDFSLVMEDRTSTRSPVAGAFTDDAAGMLSDFSGELDNGEGAVDVLVMNLRTDNLLP
jgi:hypothetical protein